MDDCAKFGVGGGELKVESLKKKEGINTEDTENQQHRGHREHGETRGQQGSTER